jgi:uncharacterized protein
MNLPGYSVHGPVGFKEVRYQWQRVMGQNQITDVYLLALVVKHKCALATLDHRIAIETVIGALSKNLLVL